MTATSVESIAPGQSDHDVAEPVLRAVVASAQDESVVQLVDRVEQIGDRALQPLGLLHRFGGHEHRRQRPLRRAATRVEQALAVGGDDRHVDDHEVLDELLAAVEQVAFGVEGQRAAVEHQLVLTADLVDVDERRVAVGRPRGEHPLAVGGLASVVRRGVDVDGELGTAVGLHGERSIGAPDVLADADADVDATDHEQLERIGLVAGSEVAGLVEHRVVGQQTLAVGAEHAAVGAHGGGVEQVEVLVDEAEHGDATSRVTGKASQRRLVVGDEARLEDEVLGRDSR